MCEYIMGSFVSLVVNAFDTPCQGVSALGAGDDGNLHRFSSISR